MAPVVQYFTLTPRLGFSGVVNCSHIPGMLATCAVNKTVTLWDTFQQGESNPPRACGSKDMGVGKLYTVNFYPSAPWLLGCAGSGKELALWDMSQETAIQNRFSSRYGGTVGTTMTTMPEPTTTEAVAETTTTSKDTPQQQANNKAETTSSKKKKDRNKKKKKAHRAGR